MKNAMNLVAKLPIFAVSLLFICCSFPSESSTNTSIEVKTSSWLAKGRIEGSAGHASVIFTGDSAKAASTSRALKLASSHTGYLYTSYYYKGPSSGQTRIRETDLDSQVSRQVTFAGDTQSPGIYPCSFLMGGNTYLFFFSGTREERSYVNGVLTPTLDSFGNPVIDYGIGSSISIYRRGAVSGDTVAFVLSNEFDTAAVSGFDWKAAGAIDSYDEVHFITCSTPCITSGTLNFTVGVGNTGLRFWQADFDGQRFSAPTRVKGKLITLLDQVGVDKVSRLFIDQDKATAYFCVCDSILPSGLGHSLYGWQPGRVEPELCPFIARCDIDASGEFGNTFIEALPKTVNHDDMNILVDAYSDGKNTNLLVGHLSRSIPEANGCGMDGYVANSVLREIDTLPGWEGNGYIDCFASNSIDLSGITATLAGAATGGSADGIGKSASFRNPACIAADGSRLFIADTENNEIRQLDLETGSVTIVAGSLVSGSMDGIGTAASFNKPRGIATDGASLYVADSGNNLIRKIELSSGSVTTLTGAADFNCPCGIATDGVYLYIADTDNNRIRVLEISPFNPSFTLAGAATSGFLDGEGTSALFNHPQGIATDGSSLYVADTGNNAIRRVDIKTGYVCTVAGAIDAGALDGIGGSASFNAPGDITTDGENLFIADTGNNEIRVIHISTGETVTLAGSAKNGCEDGAGRSASFNAPRGVATDGIRLYVADAGNNLIRSIR